ncbi:glutamine oxaloacetic transaminase [Trichuris trichiura]|uniref:Aspartate aminotransferase n=1 Tax=Trichuris trichiura TaxID=36087 RepID=A0A077Z5G3_TRITR|nr:glutamine oxaloacetic transaminase [Trichuris trichiura]
MFNGISPTPPVEVFHVNRCFQLDKDPRKVNLTIGAYRTDEGKPWILPVVREAEQLLPSREDHTHEYLPILGNPTFREHAARVLFGESYEKIKNKLATVQCLGGTGALRVGLEFVHHTGLTNTAYISDPTWGNHSLILERVGYKVIKKYRYWNSAQRNIDFEGMMNDLKSTFVQGFQFFEDVFHCGNLNHFFLQEAPERAVVVLHACAHNPTGMDLSLSQWKQLCELIKAKNLYPFFDIAYQGFATGSLEDDASAPRYFCNAGVEFSIAQSFSKNFGLYNERVGCLSVLLSNESLIEATNAHLTTIVRANYSNPPNHGSKLVEIVLSNERLKQKWLENMKEMSSRVRNVRQEFRAKLEAFGAPGSWRHITDQIGLFSFTGLNEKQTKYLTDVHHIYLLKNGRINMCGLNSSNVEYVAKAFVDALLHAS